MEPIFNQSSQLVGWLKEDKVFDRSMHFCAYIRGHGLFASGNGHIGFYINGIFRDKKAGAVAFLRGSAPGPTPPIPPTPPTPPTPRTPPTPATPPTPSCPPTPPGSWSTTTWEQLIGHH